MENRNKSGKRSVFVFALVLAAGIAVTHAQQASERVAAGEFWISGPYAHNNLSIFLVHGKERWSGRVPLTLKEALDQGRVVVHETGEVGELSIENRTGSEEIYVQAGDIVKGGQQDRVLITDLILSPRSGKVPIAAFCVDQGRWSQRGKEAVEWFASSNEQLPTKKLNLAAREKKDQMEVWREVAGLGGSLMHVPNAGLTLSSGVAETASMVITLESRPVQDSTKKYRKALGRIIDNKWDALGCVFAVNGNLTGGEIYASHELFRKMWPKLLKASAVEAVADLKGKTVFEPATEGGLKRLFEDLQKASASEHPVSSRIRVLLKESPQALLFETWDRQRKESWIHRSYLTKQ